METHRLIGLLLAALSAAVAQEKPAYFIVGGELVLDPSVPGPITSILWKYNTNLLAEWVKDKVELVYYGKFKGRATLDTNTGRLEIRTMNKTDVGRYTVEINNKIQDRRYVATVIVRVPQPVAWVRPVACTKALENCTLTCGGDDTAEEDAAQPVTYSWREDDKPWEVSQKERRIDRAVDTKVKSFSCKMENPVSEKESKVLENPFFVEDSGGSVLWPLAFLALLVPILGYLIYRFRDSICRWIRSFSSPDSDPPPAGGAELNPPKDPNGTPAETEGLQPASEQP